MPGCLTPPKRTLIHRAHGKSREDEFAWLRAENWQEVASNPAALDPEIRTYLEAENSLYRTYMADHEDLKQSLFKELKGRIKERDDSLPTKNKTHAYWSRFEEGREYSILMRAPADNLSADEIIWDSNLAALDAPYYALGVVAADPHDRLLILGEDTSGSEQYDLRILDMATGQFLADKIPATGGGGIWDEAGQSFFYLKRDAHHRPYQVLRHTLGQDMADDQLVFEETDPGFFVGVSKTESGAYILISSGDHVTSEIHLIPAHAPDTPPHCVAPRQSGHEYSLTHAGDWIYILTNQGGGAVDFEICRTPISAPGPENWKPWIEHEPGRLILYHFAVDGFLIRVERQAALPRLIFQDLKTRVEEVVSFHEPAYALGAGLASQDFHDPRIRFTYSSPSTPASTYELDLRTQARKLLKVQEVPSGHDPDLYCVERHEVRARDGARIPLTVLKRKDQAPGGAAYLYGYGSYGHAIPAGFSTHALSLVDRGLIYAIAHIRGGMEQGYSWYTDGKLEKKQNTFNDFADCAAYLIDQGLTQAGKIAIEGGSAGGLLMGAMMNQAPDLFGAVVAHVPFVDVLTTISDPTLPLTPIEWNEWGNPIEDPQAYDTIAAYSPYDQIKNQAYPPLMVTTGLADPRVTYWEPAKWVARLRDRRTNEATLIFKTNMEAGHGGRSGRFEHLWEKAESYAFILSELTA